MSPSTASGPKKLAGLKALNASSRICRRLDSLKVSVFKRAKSKLISPGPMKDRRLAFYMGQPYRQYQAQVPGYPGIPIGPLARVPLAEVVSG